MPGTHPNQIAEASTATTASHFPQCHSEASALKIALSSNCPSGAWLTGMMPTLLLGAKLRPMVFFNVGANKGFAVSAMLQRVRRAPFNSTDWFRAFLGHVSSRARLSRTISGHGEFCGACCPCVEQPPILPSRHAVDVYAFEFLPENVEWLSAAFHTFGIRDHVKLIHAAVSNASGSAYVDEIAEPGSESHVVQDTPSSDGNVRKVIVPRLALSDFVRSQGIEHIDLLSVDTEGHDALVLEGARPLLEAGRVAALEFEYHKLGFWGAAHPDRRPLRDTLSSLDVMSYTCFWQGRHGCIAPANGPCWSPKFEFHAWSNLVCAHRNLPTFSVLSSISETCRNTSGAFREPPDRAALDAVRQMGVYINKRCFT